MGLFFTQRVGLDYLKCAKSFFESRRVTWTDNFAVSREALGCGPECGAIGSQIPSVRVVLDLMLALRSNLVSIC